MTNKVQFKVPFGERNGELVSIDQIPDSQRGLECNCTCPNPECKALLQAKLGSRKKHHFAHYGSQEAHCSSETYLHKLGKRILLERVRSALSSGITELPFVWQCNKCPDLHERNLIKNIKYGEEEFSLGACQPDIALFDGNGNPKLLIEIVVTHSPEENVHKYAEENKCGLIEFHIDNMEQLEVLRKNNPLIASKVSLCARPKCKTCKKVKFRKKLHVFTAPCYNCNFLMQYAILDIDGTDIGPEKFTTRDIEAAKQKAVNLKSNYSKTLDETYLSSTCRICRKFAGQFYRYRVMPELDRKNYIDLGCFCPECEGNPYDLEIDGIREYMDKTGNHEDKHKFNDHNNNIIENNETHKFISTPKNSSFGCLLVVVLGFAGILGIITIIG